MGNPKNKTEEKNFKEEERHTFFNERSQDEGTKKHGIKEDDSSGFTRKSGESEENPDNVKNRSQQSDNDPHGSNAEFADPNETNIDYLQQPQPMSSDLENIYAGAPSTKEERDALVQERKRQQENERKDLGQAGYSSGRAKQGSDENENQGGGKDQFVDTERGNYSKHNDYQDRQGYERNKNLEDEFPNGERNRYSHIKHGLKDSTDESSGGKDGETNTKSSYGGRKDTPDFPSGMENKWDDTSANPKGYGETDFDDEEIRRRQDEGNEPWDESTGDNIDDREQ